MCAPHGCPSASRRYFFTLAAPPRALQRRAAAGPGSTVYRSVRNAHVHVQHVHVDCVRRGEDEG